jgi:hypothetical protein
LRFERAVPVLQVADVGRSIDPDGYRVSVSGSVPADANVPAARECEETAP